jgi:membrane protease YdiL (CAAX protease family)
LSEEYNEELEDELEDDDELYDGRVYRGANDPIFGLVLAFAVSLGLMALGSDGADMRYTITWGMLITFGVLSWLFGNATRITDEKPENLMWGIAFGLVLSIPLLAFGTITLSEITDLIFPNMGAGMALAYLVFIIPMGETLFFRGILQQRQRFWETGLLSAFWQIFQFFPLINRGPYPLILGVMLIMANIMYSYVKDRNGLAASWVCQITVNVVLLFLPFV